MAQNSQKTDTAVVSRFFEMLREAAARTSPQDAISALINAALPEVHPESDETRWCLTIVKDYHSEDVGLAHVELIGDLPFDVLMEVANAVMDPSDNVDVVASTQSAQDMLDKHRAAYAARIRPKGESSH